jgi:mono/diheme cytochrome c family protein
MLLSKQVGIAFHKRFLVVTALLVWGLALAGCKVSRPSAAETSVADFVKHRITVSGGDQKNPLPDTPADVAEGAKQFLNYCSSCHGADGQNGGVIFADRMSPPVPALTSASVRSYKDGQLRSIIANGIYPSGMPAWKDTLDDRQMWQVVLFIRHLPQSAALQNENSH